MQKLSFFGARGVLRRVVSLLLPLALLAAVFALAPSTTAQAQTSGSASLVVGKTVNTTAPAPGATFRYTLWFRCASITVDCTNVTMQDSVPSSLIIDTFSGTGGVVAAVSRSGNDLTWTLAGATTPGVLAAGTTGSVLVYAHFPVCAASSPAGVVNQATLAASNATTVTASAPAVTPSPAVPACPAPVPVSPPTALKKDPITTWASSGGAMWYFLRIPAVGVGYTVEDVIDTNTFKVGIVGDTNLYAGWQIWADCGSGYWDTTPLQNWRGYLNASYPTAGGGNDPTHGCNIVTNPDNNLPYFNNLVRLKAVQTSVSATGFNLLVDGFIPETVPSGTTLRNCVNGSDGGYSCSDLTVKDRVNYPNKRLLSAPNMAPVSASTLPVEQGPTDLVYEIGYNTLSSVFSDIVDPVYTDLLDPNVEFIPPSAGGTNSYRVVAGYWYSSLATPPACQNPVFEQIPNFANGRTLLRWSFPGCTMVGGLYRALAVNYSVTIKPGTPAGTVIGNRMMMSRLGANYDLSEYCPGNSSPITNGDYGASDPFDRDADGNTTEANCASSVINYTVPPIANFASSKWVKGALDSGFSRYPTYGMTNQNGDAVYELYLENTGNTPVTSVDLVDILPFVGDTSVSDPPAARLSDWNEELVSIDAIERAPVAGSFAAINAAEATLGYSTSTNPCRFQPGSSPVTNQLRTAGGVFAANASVTGPSGCATGWTSTMAAARSWALQYTPATAIAVGERIKITLTVKLNGAAPTPPAGKIAWNSFAYTPHYLDGATPAEMITTEPIKVGVRMVDASLAASLGNYVWLDTNRSGTQDPTESGIDGVTVRLYNGATLVNTVITGDNPATPAIETGWYSFVGLDPNTAYTVKLDSPFDYVPGGVLFGLGLTAANVGDDALDTDATTVGGFPTIATATTGAAGTNTPTYDFGLAGVAALGDRVWYDTDANGSQDTGETGVSGVTVTLYQPGADGLAGTADDVLVATTTTDSNGNYLFSNLTPGDYFVVFSNLPASYVFSGSNLTGNDATDSDAASSTGRTEITTLVTGETDRTWDAGIHLAPANPASLGDFVWLDTNRDGIHDATEPGVPDVVVNLLDANGITVGSTTTDATGAYSFVNLTPGNYHVQFVPPTGYGLTIANATADDQDSDADAATGETATTTLDPLEHDPTLDAGLVATTTYSLGNRVWRDTGAGTNNDNGIQDSDESGIANVVVGLFGADGTTPAQWWNGTALVNVANVTTDASGYYRFDNLDPGKYVVKVLASNFASTGVLYGATSSTGAEADPNVDIDKTDNGIDAALPATNGIVSGVVNLGLDGLAEPLTAGEPDTAATTYGAHATTTADANENLTVDFGFVQPLYAVGNFVWFDLDRNGVYNSTESAVEGMVVTLYTSNGTTIAKDASGNNVAPVTTDANGYYVFDGLAAGSYVIGFAKPTSGAFATPLTPYGFTRADQGANDAVDSDANTTSGKTAVFTLAPADAAHPNMSVVDTTDTNVTDASFIDRTLDAGLWLPVAVGDYVWYDDNHNGVQDGTEAAVENMTVTIFGADGTSDVYDANGTLVTATSTNANGYYAFDNLLPGTYVIEFSNLPSGYSFTTQAAGANRTLDSNANTTTGRATVTLGSIDASRPQMTVVDSLIDTGVSVATVIDRTIDAGIWQPLAIGDYVWVDDDHDGLQDSNESGIESVVVQLLNADGSAARDANGNLVASTETDANGYYAFDNLVAGTYRVQFTKPLGYEWTLQTQGTNVTIDANPDATGTTAGRTGVITLVASHVTDQHNMAAVISTDLVSVAKRIDRTIDAGVWKAQPGLAIAKTVKVTGSTDAFADLATAPWNSDFTWQIEVENTGNATLTDVTVSDTNEPACDRTKADTDTTGLASMAPGDKVTYTCASTGVQADTTNTAVASAVGAHAPGDTNLTLTPPSDVSDDASVELTYSLGDYVWVDVDHDGIQSGAEAGIELVTVELLDATGVLATDTTDANGLYSFEGLRPGTYQVRFVLPDGYAWTVAGAATDNDATANDSNAQFTTQDDTTASSTWFTIADGDANDTATGLTIPTIDAGVWQPASLGDYVWFDTNHNGVQDDGDTGVRDVIVELLVDGSAIDTTTTDGNGYYEFTDLVPGTYSVRFVPASLPSGTVLTTRNTGTDDGADSDADRTSGTTQTVTLAPGDHDGTLDAGIYTPLVIGDYVYFDANRDGVQGNATDEPPYAEVTLHLYDETGALVGTTTTDADGRYQFDDSNVIGGLLPNTDYTIAIDNPADFADGGPLHEREATVANQGDDDTVDSDGVAGEPGVVTIAVTTGPDGSIDMSNDFGFVTALAKFELTKALSTYTEVHTGDVVTWTFTIRNTGTGTAMGTTSVIDTLPVGLTFRAGGNGSWMCTAAANVITCATDLVFAPGATNTFTIDTIVTAEGGAITNTASVEGATQTAPSAASISSAVVSVRASAAAPVAPADQDVSGVLAFTGTHATQLTLLALALIGSGAGFEAWQRRRRRSLNEG